MSTFESLFSKFKGVKIESVNESYEVTESDNFWAQYNPFRNGYNYGSLEDIERTIKILLNMYDLVNESSKQEFTRKELQAKLNWYSINFGNSCSVRMQSELWFKTSLKPCRIEKFPLKTNGKEIKGSRYYYSKNDIISFIKNSIHSILDNHRLQNNIKRYESLAKEYEEKKNTSQALLYILENCGL